ncbi:hypothetical protein [Priestia megaterium]
MIGGQGEDSCGKSGRPRKAKPCTESNSGIHPQSFIPFARL